MLLESYQPRRSTWWNSKSADSGIRSELCYRKEVINRLQTRDGERVFLIESGDGDYRLTPYDPEFEKKMDKAEEIMARYRNTLHALKVRGFLHFPSRLRQGSR